jgi:hypothetical protein
LTVDWQNKSKTKVDKVFFFIFISSYVEMSFVKEKITKEGRFFKNRSIWGKNAAILR